MIARYVRDDARRQITVTTASVIEGTDLWEVVERQASEGTWAYKLLYDERDSTMALTPADFRKLLNYIEELTGVHGARGRVAIVARVNELELLGMYSQLAESVRMTSQVFLDIDVAQAWLDGRPEGP
jgi:hypothetical protein